MNHSIGPPFLGAVLAGADGECFVDTDRFWCADPVDISVEERLAPAGDGVVDCVPVSAELTGDLGHGAAVLTDLLTGPHSCAASEALAG